MKILSSGPKDGPTMLIYGGIELTTGFKIASCLQNFLLMVHNLVMVSLIGV